MSIVKSPTGNTIFIDCKLEEVGLHDIFPRGKEFG
jgi:hypothetical protein